MSEGSWKDPKVRAGMRRAALGVVNFTDIELDRVIAAAEKGISLLPLDQRAPGVRALNKLRAARAAMTPDRATEEAKKR